MAVTLGIPAADVTVSAESLLDQDDASDEILNVRSRVELQVTEQCDGQRRL